MAILPPIPFDLSKIVISPALFKFLAAVSAEIPEPIIDPTDIERGFLDPYLKLKP